MDLEDISTYNLYDLACCHHYLKDYKEAYKNYLNALSLDRYNIKAINNLGCLYYETKNYQDAFDSFSLSISYTKNNPEAYYYPGILYREFLNDIELSVLHLKRAVWLDPEHLETYLELIKTYKKSNNTDGIKDIEQTISEKFPNCNYEKIA